jgi:Ca2+-transporting ATPase
LYQESKTERTLQALRDLSSPRALVVRWSQSVAGREVVRATSWRLQKAIAAADALIVSGVNLTAEESS